MNVTVLTVVIFFIVRFFMVSWFFHMILIMLHLLPLLFPLVIEFTSLLFCVLTCTNETILDSEHIRFGIQKSQFLI